jgi:hypothetical protein
MLQVDVENTFNNIVPYTGLFYGVHSFFNYQHGWHVEGSPLLNQFWTQGKVTP